MTDEINQKWKNEFEGQPTRKGLEGRGGGQGWGLKNNAMKTVKRVSATSPDNNCLVLFAT